VDRGLAFLCTSRPADEFPRHLLRPLSEGAGGASTADPGEPEPPTGARSLGRSSVAPERWSENDR